MSFAIDETFDSGVNIKVVGVGGAETTLLTV